MPSTTYHTENGELLIEFDHHRAEPATLEYPGREAGVEVTSVQHYGVEIINQCSDKMIKIFEEKCWEALENDDDKE